jgi:hypothetical protein
MHLNRIAIATVAAASALAVGAPSAVAAWTGRTQNSPTSEVSIRIDNDCYAAKLGSSQQVLWPSWKSNAGFSKGFLVPKGRKYTAIKNNQRWIYNVTSQGNAVCHSPNDNVIVINW